MCGYSIPSFVTAQWTKIVKKKEGGKSNLTLTLAILLSHTKEQAL